MKKLQDWIPNIVTFFTCVVSMAMWGATLQAKVDYSDKAIERIEEKVDKLIDLHIKK